MGEKQAEEFLIDITEYWTIDKCRECECLQGVLTQLSLKFPDLKEDVERLTTKKLHKCLDCEPCLPAELWVKYSLTEDKD